MKHVSFVYAQSRNGIIGRDGGLPWHIGSDLKRFKAITMGKPVVMGRKTWDSLPRKPLPGRLNIVVTRQPGWSAEGAIVAHNVPQALALAGDVPEVCVIGGAEVFNLFLPHATRIYLTEVDLDVQGDTPALALDAATWRETAREVHAKAEGDSAGFTLRVLERAKT